MSITKLFRGATRYIPENDETKWGTELTQLLVDIVDWCNANETFWANVKDEDYGAIGDGVTDDTASIQEALDEIEAEGGGIVYIPSGTYVVTSISVGDNVTLLTSGPSTIIQQKSGQPVGTRVIYVVGSNVRIGDIYVKGNIATDSGEQMHCIFVQGTTGAISNITLGNIYGENIRGDVIYLGGTTTYPLYNVKIESIYGTNIYRDICTITGGQNIQIGSISGSQIGFYTFNTEPNPSSQACTDIKIGIIKGHGVCLLGYQSTVLVERVIIDHLDLSSAYSVGSTPQYPVISHPFHTALQLRCCRGITVNKFKANTYSSFGVRVIWETNDVETTDVEFGYINFIDCSTYEATYTTSMLLVKSDNVTIKGGRVEQYDNTRFFAFGDNTTTVHFYNIDFTPSGNDLGRIINECGPGSIFYNIKANTTTDTYPFYYISKCKISNCNITHGRLLGYSHNVLIENSTITVSGVLFNAGYEDHQIVNSNINSLYYGSKIEIVATTAPASGTWKIGDICWNSAPTSTERILGWICVVAGTPGTWEPFGVIGHFTGIAAPTTGTWRAGDVLWQVSNTNLNVDRQAGWVCVTAGTPGTWKPFGAIGHMYGVAAPTIGAWETGDVIWNRTPTAGQFVGWVCVTAGSPGTWKTFGAITA